MALPELQPLEPQPRQRHQRLEGAGRDSHCQRVYIVGEVFYEPVPGFKIPPADHIMPAEISDRKWHSGEPVNRLVAGTDHE